MARGSDGEGTIGVGRASPGWLGPAGLVTGRPVIWLGTCWHVSWQRKGEVTALWDVVACG